MMPALPWIGRVAALLLAGLGALAACHHRTSEGTTLEGTVRATGVAPFPEVLLLPADGGKGIPLEGPAALARVAGLQIAAAGRWDGARFAVERFTVQAANGVQAADGKLVDENGRLYLVTAEGARHALANPPPGLSAHAGHRVWVTGPLDREPVAYGLIE